ncbi:MAG: hypothetical protein AAF907_09560 [Planctomycetota bacterium]
MRIAASAAVSLVLSLLAGCGEEEPPPRVLSVLVDADDPLSDQDVRDFLRLAATLSAEELALLAEARPAMSIWPADSTRTVAGLAENERRVSRDRLHGADFAEAIRRSPKVARHLERIGWSAERFASVGTAIGFAAAANDLHDRGELKRLRDEARHKLTPLETDHRSLRRLSGPDLAAIRRRAAWIPRAALLEAVLGSPPENRRLALQYSDQLAETLPPGFDRTALDRLLSDRERSAIPFHEPDPTRDDALLRWDGSRVVSATPDE